LDALILTFFKNDVICFGTFVAPNHHKFSFQHSNDSTKSLFTLFYYAM